MKKYMSGFVAVCLVLALFAGIAPGARAAEYKDVSKDHWAYNYIMYLSDKNVLSGDGDGTFRPDASVTRAEFIRMMVSTFGLTEQEEITYTKVPEWAVPFVRCAAAQGFLLNYKKDADFGAKLSRQEAVALLLRYLDFTASKDFDTSKIPDYKSIGEIYRPYVLAAVENGIVTGYEDGSFKPSRILTRAEALTILYQSAGSIYNISANSREVGGSDKNATINNSISLTGLTLSGNVYITEGARFVTLNDCTINGDLYIRGSSHVNFSHCTIDNVSVQGADVTISLGNTSSFDRLDAYGKTTLTINAASDLTTAIFHAGSEGSTIRGEGTMQNYGVYCQNVSSQIEPDEYYIASGVTSMIGGVSYPAGSGRFKNSGLSSVTAKADSGKIVVSAEANVDGTVYAALWMNHKTPLSLVEIIEQASQTVKVKKGEKVSISLNCVYDPLYYTIGLVVMPDGENAAALAPLYNQSTISSSSSVTVGTRVPEAKKVSAPTATLTLGSGILALEFDQTLYYQADYSRLEPIDGHTVITSVTAQSGQISTAVPETAYRLEMRTVDGKTGVNLYFYDGIPADTSYTVTVSDRVFSIYGIAPEKLTYTSPVARSETVIQPTFSPTTKHISRGSLLTIHIPEAAVAMRYTYTIDGHESSLTMTTQGNADLEFGSLPANTKIHVSACTLTASGNEIGKKIEGDFIVNAAPIVLIGGVSYTDPSIDLLYSGPVSVSAVLPVDLTGDYSVRLYVSGREITEPMLIELAGTQIHAELFYRGEKIGETNINLQ
ncbi:MAG: S-layer homology domain-containing protein [Oscillospiraceae bacterium]|nr:S-layer homology domain-containing protein [Oscillospiraceae bacterium]